MPGNQNPNAPPKKQNIALICKIVMWYLIPYTVDYFLDFFNGYNFIMGTSLVLIQFCETNYTIQDKYDCFGPEFKAENRITWGIFSIFLTFLPGIAFAFVRVFLFLQEEPGNLSEESNKKRQNDEKQSPQSSKETIASLAMQCLGSIIGYPFYVAFKHLNSCWLIISGEEKDKLQLDILLNFGILEVVLEAGPQVILQLHTIFTGFCPTLLQVLSIISSLFFIIKTGAEFHIGSEVFHMGFRRRSAKVMKLLFLFLTCIIFRMGTLALLVTHINWWVVVPCLTSSIWVAILAKSCGLCLLPAISTGPINLFIMGCGINLDRNKCWKPEAKEENMKKFYRKSTVFMFFWNTLLLSGFLVAWTFVADCETSKDFIKMNTFYQAEWRQKVFMREEIRGFGLYTVAGGIIFSGILNLLFLFINPDKELHGDGRGSAQEEERSESTEINEVD